MGRIIGIAGRKFAGKDTAAGFLVKLGYENVKMAGALKGMLRFYLDYVGVKPKEVERMIEGDLKEVESEFFGGKTARNAMQTLGTEWGRDLVYTDIWVDSFMRRAAQFDDVVCSDVRFPNEVDIIRNAGGRVYRIERPAVEGGNAFSDHPSEKLIDTLDVDDVIKNDKGLPDLRVKLMDIHNGFRPK